MQSKVLSAKRFNQTFPVNLKQNCDLLFSVLSQAAQPSTEKHRIKIFGFSPSFSSFALQQGLPTETKLLL
jgi:hypothetical protein